ncbi:MAG: hypothetical protein ACYTEW_25170, partial [Planctomycetota bacterium]
DGHVKRATGYIILTCVSAIRQTRFRDPDSMTVVLPPRPEYYIVWDYLSDAGFHLISNGRSVDRDNVH